MSGVPGKRPARAARAPIERRHAAGAAQLRAVRCVADALGDERVLAEHAIPHQLRLLAEQRDLLRGPHEQHEHPVVRAREDERVRLARPQLDHAVAPDGADLWVVGVDEREAAPVARAAVRTCGSDLGSGRRRASVGADDERAVDVVLVTALLANTYTRRAAAAPAHVDQAGLLAHLRAGVASGLDQREVERRARIAEREVDAVDRIEAADRLRVLRRDHAFAALGCARAADPRERTQALHLGDGRREVQMRRQRVRRERRAVDRDHAAAGIRERDRRGGAGAARPDDDDINAFTGGSEGHGATVRALRTPGYPRKDPIHPPSG